MNLTFIKEDKKILQKLNEFVLWGGRYPSPKKYDTNFRRTSPTMNETDEHEIIDKIYRMARTELDILSRQQWDRQGG